MILNVYKEKGWTSFDVVKKLKGVLDVKKIGHAGTLDPLAEGVLVILTNSDTKKQEHIMKMKKEYVADIAFGAVSESFDLEQPIEITSYGELFQSSTDKDILIKELNEKLVALLPKFIGELKQKVPAHSAVKVDGKRLYKKARAGNIDPSDVPEKDVIVFDLYLENLEYNEELQLPVGTFVIECSKGFYVRSFANDVGEQLETGGVLINLVRTRVGNYAVAASKPISSFLTATL